MNQSCHELSDQRIKCCDSINTVTWLQRGNNDGLSLHHSHSTDGCFLLPLWPAFHPNLIAAIPEAQSVKYTAICWSVNDTSCVHAAGQFLSWYTATLGESLHRGQTTIPVFKPYTVCTRANGFSGRSSEDTHTSVSYHVKLMFISA